MSARDLAAAAGVTHTYVNARLTKVNPETGLLTPVNMRDLAAFGEVFGLHPGVMVERAQAALDAAESTTVISLQARRDQRSPVIPSDVDLTVEPSAAEPVRRDIEGDTEGDTP